jgi:hypothetical protein
MFRRPSTTYWQDTRHGALVSVVFVGLIFAFGWVAQLAFPLTFINLQSVAVADSTVNEDPIVTAWRDIPYGGELRYSVHVRRYPDETIAFVGNLSAPIEYRHRAGLTNPLVMPLSEWMTEGDYDRLIESGNFGPGTYFIVTCHHGEFLGFWPVSRCVDSAAFQREGEP